MLVAAVSNRSTAIQLGSERAIVWQKFRLSKQLDRMKRLLGCGEDLIRVLGSEKSVEAGFLATNANHGSVDCIPVDGFHEPNYFFASQVRTARRCSSFCKIPL